MKRNYVVLLLLFGFTSLAAQHEFQKRVVAKLSDPVLGIAADWTQWGILYSEDRTVDATFSAVRYQVWNKVPNGWQFVASFATSFQESEEVKKHILRIGFTNYGEAIDSTEWATDGRNRYHALLLGGVWKPVTTENTLLTIRYGGYVGGRYRDFANSEIYEWSTTTGLNFGLDFRTDLGYENWLGFIVNGELFAGNGKPQFFASGDIFYTLSEDYPVTIGGGLALMGGKFPMGHFLLGFVF